MMECGHQMPEGCAQLIGIGLQRCKPANAQSIPELWPQIDSLSIQSLWRVFLTHSGFTLFRLTNKDLVICKSLKKRIKYCL